MNKKFLMFVIACVVLNAQALPFARFGQVASSIIQTLVFRPVDYVIDFHEALVDKDIKNNVSQLHCWKSLSSHEKRKAVADGRIQITKRPSFGNFDVDVWNNFNKHSGVSVPVLPGLHVDGPSLVGTALVSAAICTYLLKYNNLDN